MAITASSPDAFFDGEDFAWDFTVTNADGSPLNLTGSRLFARFEDKSQTVVGICDTALSNQSLVITNATAGAVSFLIPKAGRTWSPQFLGLLRLAITEDVFGDLYRYADGMTHPQGICRIGFTVLPGTGSS